MPDNKGERRECLIILEKVDWKEGLLKSLVTDAEVSTYVPVSQTTFSCLTHFFRMLRLESLATCATSTAEKNCIIKFVSNFPNLSLSLKFSFGKNKRSLPTVRSFWAILWDQFDEFYMQVLIVLGFASLALALFSSAHGQKWSKILEAISIFFAVFFAGILQTLCDWGKEKQFLRLRSEIMNEKVHVLRGQSGTTQTILVEDLVVGDIVLLNEGDRVPADCLLIEEMDMFVDQKQFYPADRNSEMTEKQCSNEDVDMDTNKNPDPILLQDSIVMRGSGKAVVLAVGSHTLKEREISENLKDDKYALQIEKTLTPFQTKLETLAEIVGTYAKLICVAAAILFGVVWLLFVMCTGWGLVDSNSIEAGIDLACTVAALLAVCIPEGMPLVISMAMAFSVDSLKKENLLIKNLDALETSGQIIDIVTGKTATLTNGDLEVSRIHVIDQVQSAERLEFNEAIQRMLNQAIVLNCSAHMQMRQIDEVARYTPVGSPVEVGLLKFVSSQGKSVQDMLVERERNFQLQTWIPFSSDRRCMTVAFKIQEEGQEFVRVIMKGAPETVIPKCVGKMDSYCQVAHFDGSG